MRLITLFAILFVSPLCLGNDAVLFESAKLVASDVEGDDWAEVSVAVSGNVAVVGASREDEGGSDAGAAYVFELQDGEWVETAKLNASHAEEYDNFGWSVAVSGSVIVVGAPQESEGAGAAYVFELQDGGWVETAKLNASHAEGVDWFGSSVAVSGDVAVVGAPREDEGGSNAGAAYVFQLQSGSWVETAKLTASDAERDDAFGGSVAVSGSVIVVGADEEDEGGNFAGAAYVFELEDGSWVETAKLMASDAEEYDEFGNSVAVSGNVAVVGAPYEDEGGYGVGAAYVFELEDGEWVETAKLMASDAEERDAFGDFVAVDGNVIVVGVPQEDEAGNNAGAAYMFALQSGEWVETAKLMASDAEAGNAFGHSLAVSGNLAVAGAPFGNTAYVHDLPYIPSPIDLTLDSDSLGSDSLDSESPSPTDPSFPLLPTLTAASAVALIAIGAVWYRRRSPLPAPRKGTASGPSPPATTAATTSSSSSSPSSHPIVDVSSPAPTSSSTSSSSGEHASPPAYSEVASTPNKYSRPVVEDDVESFQPVKSQTSSVSEARSEPVLSTSGVNTEEPEGEPDGSMAEAGELDKADDADGDSGAQTVDSEGETTSVNTTNNNVHNDNDDSTSTNISSAAWSDSSIEATPSTESG